MGLLELIEQKAFLGTEFLTWLWRQSELRDGRIDLGDEPPLEVALEDTLTLEAPYGEATVQVLRGEAPGRSPEARAALIEGKKAQRAKLRLSQGEMQWTLTLRADTFDFSGIRIPAPKGLPFEEGVSLRLQAAEALLALMDKLFAAFLAVRLDPQAWPRELKSIRGWIAPK